MNGSVRKKTWLPEKSRVFALRRKGGRNKWGQRSTEHGSRSVPRTGQIRMKNGGNNEVRLEKGRSHATSTSKLVDVKGEEGGAT